MTKQPINIWLDDLREAPTGFVRCYWPDEVIDLYKKSLLTGEQINCISLDHDLGNDRRGTGYDVVVAIEQSVFDGNPPPNKILIHSANSAARMRMEAGIQSINMLWNNKKDFEKLILKNKK